MLRITIEEKQTAVILRLEGQLIGPWVADVEQCWRNVFATRGEKAVQVDLSAVHLSTRRVGRYSTGCMMPASDSRAADQCCPNT